MTAASLACLLAMSLPAAADSGVAADYVIEGATIYEGTGGEGFVGDVALRGERIVALGRFAYRGQPRVIDGRGLIAAPGFIDLHTHSDRPITRPPTRDNANYLFQGVTSVVTGNCGGGQADVAPYLANIDRDGAGTNVLHLTPHGAIRSQVMSGAARPCTPGELEQMKRLVDQAMQDGAWGMSTGLIYAPGSFAEIDELAELARVVQRHGGIYVSHMRDEGSRLLQAIRETLEIGQRSGAPVHISHFKNMGPQNWGQAADAIELVADARRQGQAVTADQYPYTASSTSLAAMTIPDRYRSPKKLWVALEDPQQGPPLRQQIQGMLTARGGGDRLVIASYAANRAWQGHDLASLAKQQGRSVLELVLDIQRNDGATMVNFGMSEEEVRLIMQQDFVATASDGSAMAPDEQTQPHPRSYGCFPRKIGRYAIEGGVISLAQAIRSATSLPADILQLPQRGRLAPGCFADVVLFDPESFRDAATFDQPHQYAAGVRYLFVNGIPAVANGQLTGALAGRAIRHESPSDGGREPSP